MTDREIMTKKLASYQFMVSDLKLYLDTHPNDKATIDKLREYTEKYMAERAKFEKLYGPLTATDEGKNRWSWIKAPWPWENEEEI
ncbi:MAG: spore coat protein CotJB [Ruminococcus sp.]|nr:spore coat protein CotJB [Ruminococcus sp.]